MATSGKYAKYMKYIGFILMLSLAGCTSIPPYPKAKINGLYDISGSQIYSPNERGWYVIERSQNSIIFGTAPSGTASVVAGLNLFWVGELEDDTQFLQFIISERDKNSDTQRWKNTVVENKFITFKGNSCVSYKSLAEDHQSKTNSTKSFQYYHTIGTICRHPANKNTAVQVEVSYRDDNKELPVTIENVATQFINNLVLLDKGF